MKRPVAPLFLLLVACGPEPAPAPVATRDAAVPVADIAPPTAAMPAPDVGGAAPDDARVVLRFNCRGSDGDWRLRLTADGRGRLREEAGDTDLAGELKATAGGHAWRGSAVDAPAGSFAALLTPAACFPPEGGNAKEFTVALGWPDDRRGDGCCTAVRGLDVYRAAVLADARPPRDWSDALPARLDAAERCARDAGVDARAVVHLRETDAGRIVVRLRDSDGARFDCLLDPAGGDIEAVSAVRAGDRAADEGRSEWLPAEPDAPPALDCGRVFATPAADGVTAGWLHLRDGC